MRTLHIMAGLPASGKSTFCDQHGKDDIVIHRDIVRQNLRELLKSNEYFPCTPDVEYDFYAAYILAAGRASNKDIWIDQTTLSDGSARKLLRMLDTLLPLKELDVVLEVMQVPYEVCLERNNKRTGFTRVPEETMGSMRRGFTISLTSFTTMDGTEIPIHRNNHISF